MGINTNMIKRLIIYVLFAMGFQASFLLLNAPSWTYPFSTLLFLVLFTLEFINIKRNKKPHPPAFTTSFYDPSVDLVTAKRVQEALLAIDPPETEKIKIVRRCVPASTLGGDFYTFINKTLQKISKKEKSPGIIELVDNQENIIGITIGDVAGHGVSSALVMALSSGLLGRIGLNNKSPAVILQRANIDIQKFISQSQISHVTAFYGNINLDTMTLNFANAGHPPGLIIHEDGSYESLNSDGIFLGMYPDEVYQEKNIGLAEGDRILLYTDGIIETINSNREAFGIKRLVDIAIENKAKEADAVLELIFETLFKFREGNEQKDDQTLIIIDVK